MVTWESQYQKSQKEKGRESYSFTQSDEILPFASSFCPFSSKVGGLLEIRGKFCWYLVVPVGPQLMGILQLPQLGYVSFFGWRLWVARVLKVGRRGIHGPCLSRQRWRFWRMVHAFLKKSNEPKVKKKFQVSYTFITFSRLQQKSTVGVGFKRHTHQTLERNPIRRARLLCSPPLPGKALQSHIGCGQRSWSIAGRSKGMES